MTSLTKNALPPVDASAARPRRRAAARRARSRSPTATSSSAPTSTRVSSPSRARLISRRSSSGCGALRRHALRARAPSRRPALSWRSTCSSSLIVGRVGPLDVVDDEQDRGAPPTRRRAGRRPSRTAGSARRRATAARRASSGPAGAARAAAPSARRGSAMTRSRARGDSALSAVRSACTSGSNGTSASCAARPQSTDAVSLLDAGRRSGRPASSCRRRPRRRRRRAAGRPRPALLPHGAQRIHERRRARRAAAAPRGPSAPGRARPGASGAAVTAPAAGALGGERRHRGDRCRAGERRVVVEDRHLQRLQLGRRVEAELVGEHRPGPGERPQRVGLAAGAVEGEHQPAHEALAQRVLVGQPLEPGGGLGRAAQREQRVEALLGRRRGAARPSAPSPTGPTPRRRRRPGTVRATHRAPRRAGRARPPGRSSRAAPAGGHAVLEAAARRARRAATSST